MSQRIGILGGISHESTAVYYERIHAHYFARCGDYHYPEVLVYSLNFQKFTDFEDRGDTEGYIRYILSGLRALEDAGADFALMAANSPHAVYAQLVDRSQLPLLSIVDVTAAHAAQQGLRRLLLLGIRFTMQQNFYAAACAQHGIDVIVPTAAHQERINRIIFDELVVGDIRPSSRQQLQEIIDQHAQRDGIDGVILGCTELPLILQPGASEIPLLNTLDLHVRAALDRALADETATAHHAWHRGDFTVSTDPTRLDLDVLHGYLTRSYWTPGIPREVVARAARNSLCFGLYEGDRMIGYARVITDHASFAYLADVFVLPAHRGQGLGTWLIECVVACPALQGIRSFWLATRDAHDLYRKFGFEIPTEPERYMVAKYEMPWYRPELADS